MSDDDAHQVALTAAYEGLSGRDRREVTLVEYHCTARHCLLLTVWQSPAGRFVYKPGSRHSPLRRTGQTAAEARVEFRGVRRFPARTFSLDDPRLWLSAGEDRLTLREDGDSTSVACDHVRRSISRVQVLADVDAGHPGRPVVRRVSAAVDRDG